MGIGRDGPAGLVGAALVGMATWTGVEYLLHRVAMHEMRGRGLPSKEHLRHHADVTYFSPASKKAASAVAGTAVAFPAARAVAGTRVAVAFTGGLIGMYYGYEVLHRRVHTHPPTTRYGRWRRRNHLDHHYGGPMRNHGVTTPFWDRLFGTAHEPPGMIRVPRRMAPVWLLDESGHVRPEYADDYEVAGPPPGDTALEERDRVAAFANQAPD